MGYCTIMLVRLLALRLATSLLRNICTQLSKLYDTVPRNQAAIAANSNGPRLCCFSLKQQFGCPQVFGLRAIAEFRVDRVQRDFVQHRARLRRYGAPQGRSRHAIPANGHVDFSPSPKHVPAAAKSQVPVSPGPSML